MDPKERKIISERSLKTWNTYKSIGISENDFWFFYPSVDYCHHWRHCSWRWVWIILIHRRSLSDYIIPIYKWRYKNSSYDFTTLLLPNQLHFFFSIHLLRKVPRINSRCFFFFIYLFLLFFFFSDKFMRNDLILPNGLRYEEISLDEG